MGLGSVLTDDYNYIAPTVAPIWSSIANFFRTGPRGMPAWGLSTPVTQPLFIPGSDTLDILANAATGQRTPSQISAQIQQATQDAIAAGADPATAAAQAQADQNAYCAISGSCIGNPPGGTADSSLTWLLVAAAVVGGIVLLK